MLDEEGQTIARSTSRDAARLIRPGTANKGMVAKLHACRAALTRGVGDVVDRQRTRACEFETARADSTRTARPTAHRWCDDSDTRRHSRRAKSRHVLQTYKRQPVAFVRGQGPRLYDVDGREYLDFVSGIGVASLGHAHPGLAAAIAEQASTLLHTSNLYYHPFQGAGGGRLARAVGPAARLLLQQRHRGQRGLPEVRAPLLVHAGREAAAPDSSPSKDGFAGRTMGALSVTHDEHYREPFMPLLGPVTFVDPDEPETLAGRGQRHDRRDHRRADSGRGRRAPAVARVRAGDQRGVRRGPARCSSPTKCSAGLGRTGLSASTSRRSAGSRI